MSDNKDDGITFNSYSKLPVDLTPTAKQVMKFAGHYVVIDDPGTDKEKKWFNWKTFHAAVDAYPGVDLTFDKFKSNTIVQQNAEVSTMVTQIVDFLKAALSVVLSVTDLEALKKNVETTFTGLKTAKDNGWADFSKSEDGKNSSWEYRVQFAFPNPDLPTDFYSLVSTIKLTADVHEQSWWWGIKSETKKNFTADISAMQLVVTKGFVAPRN